MHAEYDFTIEPRRIDLAQAESPLTTLRSLPRSARNQCGLSPIQEVSQAGSTEERLERSRQVLE